MHKTTIYLDEETHRRLRRLAEASRTTQAAILREALLAFTGGKTKKPRSVGLGRSGRGDLSARAEELLAGMGSES